MDIRVGSAPPIGGPGDRVVDSGRAVEAKVLAVRLPRRRRDGAPPSREERRKDGTAQDPPSSRVLLLMIPDGSCLPEGLEAGAYRVFLRFARR